MAGHVPRRRIQTASVPADAIKTPIERFMAFGAAGGLTLLFVTIVAIVWANSPWGHSYHNIFEGVKLSITLGGFGWTAHTVHWINDLLMAVFFFYVGLEIKREVLVGELRSPRKAAVPLFAALGGMVVPAGIYTAFNLGTDGSHGWGIPMATDIAFALGILALLGSKVPNGLKVFLTTLAVADDLGALIVIALFYTDSPNLANLGYAFAALLVMVIMNRLGVRQPVFYLLAGAFVWWFIHHSGVHATIAGVLTAMTIPVKKRVHAENFAAFITQSAKDFDIAGPHEAGVILSPDQQAIVQGVEDACDQIQSPLQSLEHALSPWVAFIIVPIFALANAGVTLGAGVQEAALSRESIGIALGLVIGKPIGVLLFSFLAVKLGIGALPKNTTWGMVHGTAWLAGIGFTMSLFIANLAFVGDELAVQQLTSAKIGVLGGSTIAAIIGLLVLKQALRNVKSTDPH